jgi:cell wall assembly regulator SMI1
MQIEEQVREVISILKDQFGEVPDGLRAGASEAKIAFAEEVIGLRLPDDLRRLLRMHDGEDYNATNVLLGGRSWLMPTTEITKQVRELCGLAARSGRLDVADETGIEVIGPAKPCYWNRRWIPFWTFDSPWAIDMDPAAGGAEGQVLAVVWDDGVVRVEFESLTAMFASYLAALRRGERRFVGALSS